MISLQPAHPVPSPLPQKDLPKTQQVLNPVCQPRLPPPSCLFPTESSRFPLAHFPGLCKAGQQRARSPTFWRQEAKSSFRGLCGSNFTLSKL